jgi:co-chaperonin GroES (HSP10)
VPASAARKPSRAKEPALGGQEGVDGAPPEVKHGDRIRFDDWPGSASRPDGCDLPIMNESDVMGVIDSPGIAFATRKAA